MFSSKLKAVAATAFISALSFNTLASEGEWSGNIGLESQLFFDGPAYEGQKRHSGNIQSNIEYYRDFLDGNARLVFESALRLDAQDSEKNLVDIQELYWWHSFENFEMTAGFRKVFWGVTETVHLVDIVNQSDRLANIDGEDKLGQPMLSALTEQDWGTIEAFALFGFREQQFAGIKSRLRSGLLVDENDISYQSSAKEKRVDFALRYSHVIGDWDIGLSYFSGTDRNPLLSLASNDSNTLKQHYQFIDQVGVDLQATYDAWLWKFEGVTGKVKNGDAYSALVGGFEHTLYGIYDSAADLGLILEYQFDDRAQSINNNDIAVAMRLALNDTQSTELLAAMSIDLDNQSQFVSIEASHRLSDHWVVEAETRWFANIDKDDLLYSMQQDDYLSIRLIRHF